MFGATVLRRNPPLCETRSTSAGALGWLSRTTGHVGLILLAFGCEGPTSPEDNLDQPPPTGQTDSEEEGVEIFATVVGGDPGSMPGPTDSEPERQASEPSEDLERLPDPLLLKAGKDPVYSVAFSPDGDIVAAGDGVNESFGFAYRGKLYLWETRSGKLIATHSGFRRPVERIAFSDSGKVVAASPLYGGPVMVWEVGQKQKKATLDASACVLGLTSDTEALVAGKTFRETNDAPQWWVIARWRFDQSLKAEDVVIQNAGTEIGLSGNKQVLFGYYPDGKVVFWSTGDWKKLGAIDVGESDSHAISDDGSLFAARVDVWAEQGPTPLDIWDVRELKLLRRDRPSTRSTSCGLSNMVFFSSGEVLAENYHWELLLRDLKTGQFFATWAPRLLNDSPNNSTISSLAYSRDGQALAAGLFYHREVALFRIAPSDLKRLRDTAKTSSKKATSDADQRESLDGTKDR